MLNDERIRKPRMLVEIVENIIRKYNPQQAVNYTNIHNIFSLKIKIFLPNCSHIAALISYPHIVHNRKHTFPLSPNPLPMEIAIYTSNGPFKFHCGVKHTNLIHTIALYTHRFHTYREKRPPIPTHPSQELQIRNSYTVKKPQQIL